MDLPILRTDDAASPAALLRTAKKALADLAACTVEPEPIAGCTLYCAPERPGVPSVNAIYDLHLAEGRGAGEVLAEVSGRCDPVGGCGGRCQLVMSAGESFEPVLGEALGAAGWRETAAELLVMQGLQVPSELDEDVQVLPARAVLGQYEALARELARSAAEETAACLVEQLDETRHDVLLGRREKQPVAMASVLGQGDVGVVSHVDHLPGEEAALQRVLTEVFELCSRAQFKTLCALVLEGETVKGEALRAFGMVTGAETSVYWND
jgi:hypothetical protein